MARPIEGKNKKNNDKEIELKFLQDRIEQLEKYSNSYDEILSTFSEAFVFDLYGKDIIKTVSVDTIKKWLTNPDQYISQIQSLMTYYYISDGNIFQMYDLIYSLPELTYKIESIDILESTTEDIKKIKRYLTKKIKHKELTRDLITQLSSRGTLIGIWLGDKENPYFYTFDNLEYVYPYGRIKGKMTAVLDLKWLDSKSEEEKNFIFSNLSPFVTQNHYNKYKDEKDQKKKKKLQCILLPVDRTAVLRVHTLDRNQRIGLPFGIQSLFDLQHKQKLKDLETAIANKIIKAIAVLKFKAKDSNDVQVDEHKQRVVFNAVKKALSKNTDSDKGITVVGLPDFADMDFGKIDGGDKVLSPEKYENINNDLYASTGVSPVLTSGIGGTFSSASINLSILYKKIAVLLEKVDEVYDLLINLILGEKGDNYVFSYNANEPLSTKERLDYLTKLQSQGYSTKAMLDLLGQDESYFKQSIYEIEELKLREKIIPPQTSYTLSNDTAGREKESNDNDGGNLNPSPSD